MKNKRKQVLYFVIFIICFSVVLLMIIQINRGTVEKKARDSEVIRAGDVNEIPAQSTAYLEEEVIVLSHSIEKTYTMKLLIDEFSQNTEVNSIRSGIQVPDILEVTDVVPNTNNLSAEYISFEKSDEGIELKINNDDSPVNFKNNDGSKELISIKFRLKKELTAELSKEIKVDDFEITDTEGNTEKYKVDGAITKVIRNPLASSIGKSAPNGNPIVSHKFGADPYALVFNDRVYIYNTNDVLEYDQDGNVIDNSYGTINKLSIVSSADLINWTDHGVINVAGKNGAAKWATQSWAPAVAHKVINGENKFFLYFANNASGIGVLTSDSPTGPWIDPIGEPLISRSHPGAEGVTWLFDPAVLVDDDGEDYIYFGGGVPEGEDAMPNTARVMKLGDDMVSVVGEANPIPAPFMFENAGINKVGDTYYYTYCSNFYSGYRPEGSPPAGEIAYMTSDHPMGPWTYQSTILKNPGEFFGVGGNNHHSIFQFHENWYIAYHAQTLSKEMGIPKGYRSTHLNKVFFNEDGSIQEIKADMEGVEPVKMLNPFIRIEAETIAWNAGIQVETVVNDGFENTMSSDLAITNIDDGDWHAVSEVDFKRGATQFIASVSSLTDGGVIDIHLDTPDGKLIGTLEVPATGGWNQWEEISTEVIEVTGIHDLYFIYRGKNPQELFRLNYWLFQE
ncbi:glycoside hydrolase family 43 protein [Gracilibacillus oryzae]|nr:glycoside hydrolase family 43 protein [Gracilibacillus oryzae]